ncbi:MAG: hypothetical protein ABIK92_05730 [Pseudomonadota bacterium]
MKIIGFNPEYINQDYRLLFKALEKLLNIRFEEHKLGSTSRLDAWFFQGVKSQDIEKLTQIDLPCYVTIKESNLVNCGNSTNIEFTRNDILPDVIQGRCVTNEEVLTFRALPPLVGNYEIVASKSGFPIWMKKEINGCSYHIVAMSPPLLQPGEKLLDHFCGKTFLKMLPLWTFLHKLSNNNLWEPSPLMSCLMFDDPNLHWRTYGFINFLEIACDAIDYNYHVAFATIPLDSWFFHSSTAEIFKNNQERLSLLIHGNDHIAGELYRTQTREKNHAMARQAIERIRSLENRSGVSVSRVTVPPHGICNNQSLEALAHAGFEAACIPRGALRRLNANKPSPHTLGMLPTDIIEGLPIIHRSSLSKESHNNILVSAILQQPIILAGHHEDIDEGLQILRELSEFINSLGTVKWASMKNISRSHYSHIIDGKIMIIKMYTKRIKLRVPEGIESIFVKQSWFDEKYTAQFSWRTYGEGWTSETDLVDKLLPVIPGKVIEIVSNEYILNHTDKRNTNSIHPLHIIRRQLTEVRDRVAPIKKNLNDFFSHRRQWL